MGTAAVQRQDEVTGVRALLRATTDRWAPFVPRGVDPEAVVQAAYLETKKNPELLRCEPESILQAVTSIQRLGLTIGVTAYLVPFGKTCTMVVGKDGIIELVVSTGVVRSVRARCVYEKEPYRFQAGTQTLVEHRPISDPDERGKMLGAYVVFRLAHGDIDAFEMSAKEIDRIRQQYSRQWKKGPLPDWYAEKTVIIHGAKQLPKNPRMAKLMATLRVVSEEEQDDDRFLPAAEPPIVHRLSEGEPRPVSTAGQEPYAEATPAAPTDSPASEPAQSTQSEPLPSGELPLGRGLSAPRRRDALKEG